MGYRTVFDVTQVGLQWWIPLLIFIFGGLFLGIGWALRTGDKDSFTKGTLFQIGGAMGILGALGFFTSMYGEYRSVQKAFAAHSYSVSEGVRYLVAAALLRIMKVASIPRPELLPRTPVRHSLDN